MINELKESLPKLSDGEFLKVCQLFEQSTRLMCEVEQHGKSLSDFSQLIASIAKRIKDLDDRIVKLETIQEK